MVDQKTKRRPSDLTNQVFGNLKVINRVKNINGRPVWSCLCLCGKTVEVKSKNLLTNKSKHCGCLTNYAEFSEEETHWIKSQIGKKDHQEVADELGVSRDQLRYHLRKNNIKWKDFKIWNKEEDQWLRDNAKKITYAEAGRHFGLDKEVVRHRVRTLRISWTDKVEKVDRQSLNVPKEWKLLPDNRTEAKKVNSIHFFTGRVCESGHLDLRLTSNNGCMECVRERSKGYYYKYHEEKKAKARERAQKRFESGAYQKYLETGGREKINKRTREREKNDLNFYLSRRLRARSKNAIKFATGETALIKTDILHGCDIEFIRKHLEALFEEGMSWQNHGLLKDGWQIDEIRPISSFDLTDIRQQKVCFNWRNRQPLWSTDNRVKYSHYSEEDEKVWIKKMRDLKFDGDLFTLY